VETSDRHLAVHNLGLVQRQAGVDPGVAELVTAYARLVIDSGRPLTFDPRPFVGGSATELHFSALRASHPGVDERFLAFLAAYSAEMTARGLPAAISREDLAAQAGYEPDHLLFIAARSDHAYREIRLPRPGRSDRILHSPRTPLRHVQQWIHRHILAPYRPHDAAHGFVRGRSIATSAALHVGRAVVITIDLADFFPTIEHRRVRKGFEKLGYPFSVAVLLANLCTRRGVLPQGAPTSPALSNLVCENLDRRLTGLARSRGFTYSRYADDLVFSSDDGRLPSLIPMIGQVIGEEGFALRSDKTRIVRRGARQMVTGVVVNERLNLPRHHVRRLRAAADRLSRGGVVEMPSSGPSPAETDPRARLEGHLAFLAMLNPRRACACRESARGPGASGPSTK